MKKILCTLAAWAALSGSAWAWPDKPVTLLVPFPPGGSTDSLARTLAAKMQEQLGQTVVVDNKPGATGTIGAGQVKRAPADGYTVLVSSLGPFVIAPHLIKSVPYDAARDFDLLMVAVQAPNVLVVPAASPLKSVADVLAAQKKQPGKVSFASSGNGSSDHLTAELFWQQTGTSGLHVPYKGGAPAITDLLGGQVEASFQNINAVISHIQAGKLRALAVTGEKRAALLPQVPTLTESGVANADVYSWQGIAAPKGLPAEVNKRLHASLVAALQDPAVRKKLTDVGFEIVANTPEQFGQFQAAEFARWKKVIEVGRITAD
ncbi:Bug family tripartite tricarboxylate transporter substrate binding protein [Rhizobacter sp. LjRoot28]|uniref:Bug family tripartite tricarboxylate transporter substrate binding protein n=1 Tax=Rhizobacter sp. LjRoot28 TaxID=3342309 RepID=UPI003ECD718D